MDCEGWRMSDCCNAPIDTDILICSACGEHCGTMCDNCEERNCNADNSFYDPTLSMEWVGKEKIEVPQYKETRFVVDFEDGLSLNVSRPIFIYVKAHHKIEYFGFYD